MAFNLRLVHQDVPRRAYPHRRKAPALAQSIASVVQGALFAFGALLVLGATFWVLGASGLVDLPGSLGGLISLMQNAAG